jgi:hypothetical protein
MPDNSENGSGEAAATENTNTPFRVKGYRLLIPNLRRHTDKRPAVFLWVGAARRPEGPEASQADLVLSYWYAPLLKSMSSIQAFPRPTDLGEPFAVTGSSAELPRVRIGRVYRDGALAGSFDGEIYDFPEIVVPDGARTRRTTLAGVRDEGGDFLVDFSEFLPGLGCTGSYVVDIPGAVSASNETHRLIFPWFTIARYFFAGSSSLLNLLFQSGLSGDRNRVYDRTQSDWMDEDVFGVRLEKWVPDKDVRVVAHIAAHGLFQDAASSLSISLAGQLGQAGGAFPNCFFPVPRMRDVVLRCVRLRSRGNTPCLLVLEILRANIANAFARNIRSIVFWRDNDGRPTMQRELATARAGGTVFTPDPPKPGSTLEGRPGVRGDTSIAPIELREEGYYSSFADDRTIPAFKPEKDSQETYSDGSRLIRTDNLLDGYTASPDGDPLHGQAARAYLTGSSDNRLSQLPTGDDADNERLRTLCGIVRALAKKDYGVCWLPTWTTNLYSYYFCVPEEGDASNPKVAKWVNRPKGGWRRYWVCEIYNEQTQRYFYLPEIEDRKSQYSGCILFHQDPNHRFTEQDVARLMALCALSLGRWRNVRLPEGYSKVSYYHGRRRRIDQQRPAIDDYVRRIETTIKRKTFRPRRKSGPSTKQT